MRGGSGPDGAPDGGEAGLAGGAVPAAVGGWAAPAGAVALEAPPGAMPAGAAPPGVAPVGVPDGEGDVVRALGAIDAGAAEGRDSVPGRAASP